MPKIQQVIEHYAEQKLNVMNGKVVNLEEYKQGDEFRMMLKIIYG